MAVQAVRRANANATAGTSDLPSCANGPWDIRCSDVAPHRGLTAVRCARAFEIMKTLAGSRMALSWASTHIAARDFSGNNLHETLGADPTSITMFYEGDRAPTYCDAGNRPRIVGGSRPDGKTVDFDSSTFAAQRDDDHMAFTTMDANHPSRQRVGCFQEQADGQAIRHTRTK